MKAFACILLVCYVAGMSAALDIKTKSNPMGNLFNQTEQIVSMFSSEAKKAEAFMNDLFKKIADTQNICKKDGTQIKCCAKDLLKNKLCLGLVTDLSDFSVRVSFSVNNRTFINQTLSGKNPPPVCAPLPSVPILKLCIEPYDLGYANNTLNVCLALSAKFISKDIARANLNCIQINKDGDISFVTPSNGTAKAIVNVDTGKVNPMLNKTINPIGIGKDAISKMGNFWG